MSGLSKSAKWFIGGASVMCVYKHIRGKPVIKGHIYDDCFKIQLTNSGYLPLKVNSIKMNIGDEMIPLDNYKVSSSDLFTPMWATYVHDQPIYLHHGDHVTLLQTSPIKYEDFKNNNPAHKHLYDSLCGEKEISETEIKFANILRETNTNRLHPKQIEWDEFIEYTRKYKCKTYAQYLLIKDITDRADQTYIHDMFNKIKRGWSECNVSSSLICDKEISWSIKDIQMENYTIGDYANLDR